LICGVPRLKRLILPFARFPPPFHDFRGNSQISSLLATFDNRSAAYCDGTYLAEPSPLRNSDAACAANALRFW
jgi:hypothetical protein